jgi:hypothetical protein
MYNPFSPIVQTILREWLTGSGSRFARVVSECLAVGVLRASNDELLNFHSTETDCSPSLLVRDCGPDRGEARKSRASCGAPARGAEILMELDSSTEVSRLDSTQITFCAWTDTVMARVASSRGRPACIRKGNFPKKEGV